LAQNSHVFFIEENIETRDCETNTFSNRTAEERDSNQVRRIEAGTQANSSPEEHETGNRMKSSIKEDLNDDSCKTSSSLSPIQQNIFFNLGLSAGVFKAIGASFKAPSQLVSSENGNSSSQPDSKEASDKSFWSGFSSPSHGISDKKVDISSKSGATLLLQIGESSNSDFQFRYHDSCDIKSASMQKAVNVQIRESSNDITPLSCSPRDTGAMAMEASDFGKVNKDYDNLTLPGNNYDAMNLHKGNPDRQNTINEMNLQLDGRENVLILPTTLKKQIQNTTASNFNSLKNLSDGELGGNIYRRISEMPFKNGASGESDLSMVLEQSKVASREDYAETSWLNTIDGDRDLPMLLDNEGFPVVKHIHGNQWELSSQNNVATSPKNVQNTVRWASSFSEIPFNYEIQDMYSEDEKKREIGSFGSSYTNSRTSHASQNETVSNDSSITEENLSRYSAEQESWDNTSKLTMDSALISLDTKSDMVYSNDTFDTTIASYSCESRVSVESYDSEFSNHIVKYKTNDACGNSYEDILTTFFCKQDKANRMSR